MEKILIVDDSKTNRNYLVGLLEEEYDVMTAENGVEALLIIRKVLPTLILLDIIMPQMDGFQVLEKLKEKEETKNIPVIFITGLADAKDEEKGLLMGAVDYIAKPFTPGIVKARVRTHVQLVEYRKTIEAMTMVDSLTGVTNRRGYEKQAIIEWARATRDRRPLSLAIADIDFFKQYNDCYGHAKGDEALQRVAGAMAHVVKRSTDFLFRYGGEEFAILMPNTPAAGAAYLAEMMRAAVEDLGIEHSKSEMQTVTISVGGATMIPGAGQHFQGFFETADQMLYMAKEYGRNRVEWKML